MEPLNLAPEIKLRRGWRAGHINGIPVIIIPERDKGVHIPRFLPTVSYGPLELAHPWEIGGLVNDKGKIETRIIVRRLIGRGVWTDEQLALAYGQEKCRNDDARTLLKSGTSDV